jgi:pyrimidine operon attenuation protein/uracil phosphoribosyltransferase
MKKETVEMAIRVLKNSIIESEEMFQKKEVSNPYIIGMLQGSISAVAEFLEKQLEREEEIEMLKHELDIIKQFEQEDFDKRDIGF